MNYASKSGWSSIKEMNSPCNLISYGSLLCWAAESNCPWKEIYLQYVLAVWNGIAIWSAHTATPFSPRNATATPPTSPTDPPTHPPIPPQRQALSTSTWGFLKKPCLQAAKTTKMLPLANSIFVVEATSASLNWQDVCWCQALVKARPYPSWVNRKLWQMQIAAQKNTIFTAAHWGVTSHYTDIIVIKT